MEWRLVTAIFLFTLLLALVLVLAMSSLSLSGAVMREVERGKHHEYPHRRIYRDASGNVLYPW